MSTLIELPENLTIHYASSYLDQVKEQVLSAEDVVFDGAKIETVDTAGVQLLLVMVKDLSLKGIGHRFESPSKILMESVQGLGLAADFNMA